MMAWDTAKQISNLRVIYKAARNTGMGSLMLGKHGDGVSNACGQTWRCEWPKFTSGFCFHCTSWGWPSRRIPRKGTCCTTFCIFCYIISYVFLCNWTILSCKNYLFLYCLKVFGRFPDSTFSFRRGLFSLVPKELFQMAFKIPISP